MFDKGEHVTTAWSQNYTAAFICMLPKVYVNVIPMYTCYVLCSDHE